MRASALPPRLLSREQAADYLNVSVDTLDRLINTGAVSLVRLPVEHQPKTGRAQAGTNRRILLDRVELDALILTWREPRAEPAAPVVLVPKQQKRK